MLNNADEQIAETENFSSLIHKDNIQSTCLVPYGFADFGEVI